MPLTKTGCVMENSEIVSRKTAKDIIFWSVSIPNCLVSPSPATRALLYLRVFVVMQAFLTDRCQPWKSAAKCSPRAGLYSATSENLQVGAHALSDTNKSSSVLRSNSINSVGFRRLEIPAMTSLSSTKNAMFLLAIRQSMCSMSFNADH